MDDSIQQYITQISQIEKALITATNEDEIKSLISLKNDLNELLTLTKETLSVNNKTKTIDDEFSLFMTEVKELEATTTKTKSENEDDTNRINDDHINTLVGTKCSAPHFHLFGSKTYHNALICGLETNDNDEQMVRVLYTNPTHQEMIPCGFYLDGHCKFNEDKCRYSHGELVRYCDIKEYKPPDFTMLNKINCLVLVLRPEDKLWHKGTITFVDFEKKICRIKLEQQKKQEIENNFEHILPLENIDNDDNSDLSSNDDDDYNNEVRNIRMIEQSLLNVPADQMLGKWEKHTKGIGSKLMYKMGYVSGTGLGKLGEGILVPVSVKTQVLPPGCSLDYCMNLREQSNGDKDLFSVEKRLQKMEKKQEQINIKAYEREKNKTDLFSFINTKVFNKETIKTECKEKVKVDLKAQTTKNLNVANFEISENIRKKEKEISTLSQSLKRHKDGTPVFMSIKTKLDAYKNELNILKNSEKSIAKEQNVRNNKNKLTIF